MTGLVGKPGSQPIFLADIAHEDEMTGDVTIRIRIA